MLSKLFKLIEKTPVTLPQWIAGFLGILLVRFFFENLSSDTFSGVMATDLSTNVHYFLFYLAVVLSLWLFLGWLIPKKREVIGAVLLFGLLLVWLAPLLDLLISWGDGFGMAYLSQQPSMLFASWLTFFGPLELPGATPGVRIEIALMVLLVAAYTKISTKSFSKAFIAAVGGYTIIFLWGSLPSVVFAVATAFGYAASTLSDINAVAFFFMEAIQTSLISTHALHPTTVLISADRAYEVFFNISLSQVYYLVIPIILAGVMRLICPKWLSAVWGNIRPERVGHYMMMAVVGMGLAVGFADADPTLSWLNALTVLTLLIAVASAWLYAVAQNDLADTKIDKKTNSSRPLISGAVSAEQMRYTSWFFLTWTLLGGYLVSHYALYLLATYIALSHVYSMPPLRLRRFPLLSTFLIGLASLSAVMAGFYTFSPDQTVDAFPISWIVLIVVIFTMAANLKDVKDRKGDAADGVVTLPVIFGDKKGRLVIGALLALSFLLVPTLLATNAIWIPTIIGAAAAVGLMIKEPFNEKWIFGLYYVYAIVVAFMLWA